MIDHSFSYTNHLANYAVDPTLHDKYANVVSEEACDAACRTITNWPSYELTNLISLSDFAAAGNVAKVLYKDESSRFGLGSFKALGGAYAVSILAQQHTTQYGDLSNFCVATATDGNHGRSVAWGAQQLGIECHIFIHANVSQQRADYMANLGATIHRIDGNYDDSLVACETLSEQHNWQIVSDTSWDGYETVPLHVMAGYSVMAKEIIDQLNGEIPSHFFIPAGCGGLAGAMLAYFWQVWKDQLPKIILVESHMSDCVLQSLSAQRIKLVNIEEETVMAGLSCGEVSKIIWPILQHGVSDVVTIPDDAVVPIMKTLSQPSNDGQRPAIEAGECSTAGLATLLAAANPSNSELRDKLEINEQSTVLVLGTEGATDPDFYRAAISS